MKKLVRASCSDHVLTPAGTGTLKSAVAKHYSLSFANVRTRVAAALVLGLFLFSWIPILSFIKRDARPTLAVESERCLLVNAPLGAIIYYQTWSGKTLQTQAVPLSDGNATTLMNSTSASFYEISGYKSPLLGDSVSYMFE
jgi:hypothetical protein